MKSIDDVNSLLKQFEKRFEMNVLGAEQKSEAWFKLKLGVISASNAYRAIAKKGSETRQTYLAELVAQVCTGIMEEINSKYLEWGEAHETSARASYEFLSGNKIKTLLFAFKDDAFREGCSPDGIINDKKGCEIKCPWNTSHYIKFLTESALKSEYEKQCQFQMRVLGAEYWDFVQYDPRMKIRPIKILTIERDLKMQNSFDEIIPEFLNDMDKMLADIGIEFGAQWRKER